MEKYEKIIGFKTAYQAFAKRWKIMLVVFFPIALMSIVVTQAFIKKEYCSTFTLVNTGNLDSSDYAKVSSLILKDETLETVSTNLANNEHPITMNTSTIKNGITIAQWKTLSPYISVGFTFSNKEITKVVADELCDVALAAVKTIHSGVSIYQNASTPSKISKDTTYLIIGLAAGAVLALGMAFIDEIISDEVYDSDDIRYLGSSSFEITASK